MKDKSLATLTIWGLDKMTPKQRERIVIWLRENAKLIIKEKDNFCKRFTARYIK